MHALHNELLSWISGTTPHVSVILEAQPFLIPGGTATHVTSSIMKPSVCERLLKMIN